MWHYLLFLLIVGGLPFIAEIIIEYRYNNNVKKCISEKTLHLRLWLFGIQNNDIDIEEQYRLTDKDISNLDIIIEQFKENLNAEFFSNRLPKYTKSTEVSYLLYLRDFVIKNQDKMKFCDIEMYQLDELTRKFHLTDFAITYHKLLCVLQIYYAKFKKIRNENNGIFHDLKLIKESIDNKWTY